MAEQASMLHILLAEIMQLLDEDVFGNGNARSGVDVSRYFFSPKFLGPRMRGRRDCCDISVAYG